MVKAIIELDAHENRILNIVKAKFDLSNKSETVAFILREYESELLEPELRPEFVQKMVMRQKEDTIRVTDFKKHFALE